MQPRKNGEKKANRAPGRGGDGSQPVRLCRLIACSRPGASKAARAVIPGGPAAAAIAPLRGEVPCVL